MCACCVFLLGSAQLGAAFGIHLEFLEDNAVHKQTLNCIMLKLFPNVSVRMEICIPQNKHYSRTDSILFFYLNKGQTQAKLISDVTHQVVAYPRVACD